MCALFTDDINSSNCLRLETELERLSSQYTISVISTVKQCTVPAFAMKVCGQSPKVLVSASGVLDETRTVNLRSINN